MRVSLYCYHFQLMQPKSRTSTCVKSIDVDPITGTAVVEFLTDTRYEYTNVSRRAIANLLAQPNMSLGFWVNANCKLKSVIVSHGVCQGLHYQS